MLKHFVATLCLLVRTYGLASEPTPHADRRNLRGSKLAVTSLFGGY
jgi:hypothetical protein